MLATGGLCRVSCFLIVLQLATWNSRPTFAQDVRIAVNFLQIEGDRDPLMTFEVVEPVSRGRFSIPALTLVTTESGPELKGFTVPLPVLKMGSLSFNPQYGDQRFDVNFLAGSLSGLAFKARRLQGLSLTTKQGVNSFSLMLGQLAGKDSKPFSSAVPRVLTLTGTLKPRNGLTVAPRVVKRLGRQGLSGSAETSAGVGVRADVSPNLHFIGDLGATRKADDQWASFAVVGAVAEWSRGSLEASVKRADAAYRLLGRVKFAEDEAQLTGKFLVSHGLMLSGKLSALQQVIEWKQDRFGSSAVRFVRERADRTSGPQSGTTTRRLQVEFKGAPLGERVRLEWRSSIPLSRRVSTDSPAKSRLKGQVAVTRQITLTGQANYEMFSDAGAVLSLRSVRVGAELEISSRTTVHLGYAHAPGSATALPQRFEARLVRTLSF